MVKMYGIRANRKTVIDPADDVWPEPKPPVPLPPDIPEPPQPQGVPPPLENPIPISEPPLTLPPQASRSVKF